MKGRATILAVAVLLTPFALSSQGNYRAEIEAHRQRRNELLRSDPLSPLSLVHREYLKGKRSFLIGSGPRADLRLTGFGVEPAHAAIQIGETAPRARVRAMVGAQLFPPTGDASGLTEIDLEKTRSFRIGNFVLNYRPTQLAQGTALDVYDLTEPAKTPFQELEFFPIAEVYRVKAQLTPLRSPQKIDLIDSQGFNRPYWIYGHLNFRVNGVDLKLEVYTPTLDKDVIKREGFMLIFADQTSGKETYSAGRYLDIEGKQSGIVEVDFNKSRNPPCNFSAVFTCPFPRRENRWRTPIRAGEKKYTGPTAKPLVQP